MPLEAKLSVLYVENDSMLRGLVSRVLKTFADIGEVFDFSTGEEALVFASKTKVNVALLDVSLGAGLIDGFATGKELRRAQPNIGVVLFSQNSYASVSRLIDLKGLEAWSYVEKKADMNMQDVAGVIKKSYLGISNVNLVEYRGEVLDLEGVGTKLLTQRQDVIMSLLACGYEPKFIASRLEVSAEVVRKDLSKAYAVLVPEPAPGSDLRISAILKYQKLVGNLGLDEI